jgi:hypothetical protein
MFRASSKWRPRQIRIMRDIVADCTSFWPVNDAPSARDGSHNRTELAA